MNRVFRRVRKILTVEDKLGNYLDKMMTVSEIRSRSAVHSSMPPHTAQCDVTTRHSTVSIPSRAGQYAAGCSVERRGRHGAVGVMRLRVSYVASGRPAHQPGSPGRSTRPVHPAHPPGSPGTPGCRRRGGPSGHNCSVDRPLVRRELTSTTATTATTAAPPLPLDRVTIHAPTSTHPRDDLYRSSGRGGGV